LRIADLLIADGGLQIERLLIASSIGWKLAAGSW
jgi:hypothetical protein